MNHVRRFFPLAAIAALALVSSCVDGGSPTSLNLGGTASLAIVPTYAPGPQPAEGDGAINRIRITARLQGTGAILATFVRDVDPAATEWGLNLEIPIPEGGGSVILTIELVNVATGGAETVQWSGQSAPLPLTPGQSSEVKEVPVVRGPTENLTVTSVTVAPDSARILEGESVQLSASVTSTGSATPLVFWTSLDTAVATVDANGLVVSRLPGVARIVAQSGAPMDTARVVVVAIPVGVTLTPAEITLSAAGEEAQFSAQVVDVRNNAIAGEGISWTSKDPQRLEHLGNGRFRALSSGNVEVEARSTSNPTLTATGRVLLDFPQANLALSKSTQVTQATLGDTVAFTVTVTNLGPDAAGSFVVEDFAPGALTYVDGSAPTGSVTTSPLRWSVPGLASGASATWRLDFRVDGAGEPLISNAAEIISATTHDPESSNNRDTQQLGIATDADVGVDISTTSSVAVVGDTFSVTTQVTNAGPATARDVQVSIPVPTGLTRRNTSTSEGSFDSGSGVWTVGQLASGTTATLVHGVAVEPGAPATLTLTADYQTFAPATDPVSGNNTATTTVQVSPNTVDLTVRKRFHRTAVLEQDTVRWTVSVVNRGPAPLRALKLVDSLDVAGFSTVTLVGATRMRSTNTGGGRDILEVDSLAAGDSAQAVFQGVVRAGTAGRTLWNRVRFSEMSTLLTRINPGDDADSASVTVASNVADLHVAKRVNRDTVYAGDTVRYVVAVRNRGSATARRVELLDTFNTARFRSVTVTSRRGLTGSVPGRLLSDSLVAGDSAVIEIMAVLDSSAVGTSVLNRAGVTRFEGARDTLTANDTASASVFVSPRLTDLVVRKTVSKDTAGVGDTLVYNIQILNQGPSRILGFELEEVMDRVALVDLKVSQNVGISGAIPGVLQGGPLAAGERALLIFTGVVAASADGTHIRNGARIVSVTGATDTGADNNGDSVSTWVASNLTDISVRKAVSRAAADAGDSLIYEVRVVNNGPRPVDSVAVVDFMDSWAVSSFKVVGSTFARGSSVGSPDGDTLVTGSLAVGDTARIRWKALVDRVAAGDTIWNDVFLQEVYGGEDVTPGNDADSVWTVISDQADLAVSKWVDDTNPFEGDTVVFSVAVENYGPGAATNVRIQDVGDIGVVKVVGHTRTAGTVDTLAGVWTLPSLSAGGADTLRLWVRVDSGTVDQTLYNRAWSQGLVDQVDPDASNDTALVSVLVGEKSADLALHKFVDNSEPYEGDTVTYLVELQNFGSHTAKNVLVFDSLGAGLTKLSSSATRGSFDAGAKTWTVDTLAPGQTDTLTLKAVVGSGTVGQTLWNRAGAYGLSEAVESDASNDTASVSVTVGQRSADLALHKFVDNSEPYEGDTVTYLVELQNFGSHTAKNVLVFDSLGAGLTKLSSSATRGSFDAGAKTWTVDTLAPGQTDTLTLKVKVDSGTVAQTLWNRAGAYGLSEAVESDASNDTASVSVTVGEKQADLYLRKTADRAGAQVGDTIKYTLVVENLGSYPATGVVVLDTLPSYVTLEGSQATSGSYNGTTHEWGVSTVGVGTADTLTVKAVVTAGSLGDTIRNVAWLKPLTAEKDPDLSNNADSVKVSLEAPDLQVIKTVSNTTPVEGEAFSYKVTVRNVGAAAATAVQVYDSVPPGTVLQGTTPSQGSFANAIWSVGTVAAGDSALLDVSVRAAPGASGSSPKNTASVLELSEVDSNASNDSDTASVTVSGDDYLDVYKTVNDVVPALGDTVKYKITVKNHSAGSVSGVAVRDTIQNGLIYVSTVPSQGSFSQATWTWSVGTIAAGDSASMEIAAYTGAGSLGNTIRNTAWASSPQTETVTTNDSSSVTLTVTGVDIGLTKTTDRSEMQYGDTVTFTLKAKNTGPSTATNLVVNDDMPNALSVLASSPSQGSFNAGTGNWSVGSLAAGDSALMTLTARADTSAGSVNNWIQLAGLDQDDTSAVNDTAAVGVTIYPDTADLTLTMTDLDDSYGNVGDTVGFQLTLMNNGPDSLESVLVYDTLPSGIDFWGYSIISGGGSYTGGTGLWNIPGLGSGAQAQVILRGIVQPEAAGLDMTNEAFVVSPHASLHDPDLSNDTADHTISVDETDLDVYVTVNKSTPLMGDSVLFTILVENSGGDFPADTAEIIALLPTGLTYMAHTVTDGTYDHVTGKWGMGHTGYPGNTLELLAMVDTGTAGQTLEMIASLDGSFPYDPYPDGDTDTAYVAPGSDLGVAVGEYYERSTIPEGVADSLIYGIAVTNYGFHTVTNIVVHDTVPGSLTFSSYQLDQPTLGTFSVTGGVGVWTIDSIPADSTVTLWIQADHPGLTGGTTVTNSVRIISFDHEPDVDASDNVDTLSVAVEAAAQQQDTQDMAALPGLTPALGPDSGVTAQPPFRARTWALPERLGAYPLSSPARER